MPGLPAEVSLHHRQGTPDHPLGTRASGRGDAKANRRWRGMDAAQTRHRRAPIRHDQGVNGRDPLPDAALEERPDRDSVADSGLQHQANALDDGNDWPDGGAIGLTGGAEPAPRSPNPSAAKSWPPPRRSARSFHTASDHPGRAHQRAFIGIGPILGRTDVRGCGLPRDTTKPAGGGLELCGKARRGAMGRDDRYPGCTQHRSREVIGPADVVRRWAYPWRHSDCRCTVRR